jgi:lipopolysaccharide/colanic/teichoic acid biosynthesis glycosyltransferase
VVSAPLSAPLALLGWLAVRATDATPLFRQTRLGRDLEPFVLLKLRTMRPVDASGPEASGWSPVTVLADPRIPRLGSVLRRFRVDELPQLWNVLRGEMTLVGPRPEVPECVAGHAEDFRRALSVPPGLTGLTTLVFLDEAVRLAAYGDPADGYRSHLLPVKLELDRIYADRTSFGLDLRVLGLTLLAVLAPDSARRRALRLADDLRRRADAPALPARTADVSG